jgi:hypothetical protein
MPVAFSDEIEAGMQQFDVEMLYFVTWLQVMALKALTRLTIRLREPQITELTLSILSRIIENGGAYRNINNLR